MYIYIIPVKISSIESVPPGSCIERFYELPGSPEESPKVGDHSIYGQPFLGGLLSILWKGNLPIISDQRLFQVLDSSHSISTAFLRRILRKELRRLLLAFMGLSLGTPSPQKHKETLLVTSTPKGVK